MHVPLVTKLLRLHRDQRGVVQLILLIVILTLFALHAMIWDTGEVLSRKVHAQTAADTASFSAGMIMSRSTNLITAGNILIVDEATAQTMIDAAPVTSGEIVASWIKAVSGKGWAGLAIAARIIWNEVPVWLEFNRETVAPHLGELFSLRQTALRKITAIHEFQNEVYEKTPETIRKQMESMQDYYGCKIIFVQPHMTDEPMKDIYPPVRKAAGLLEDIKVLGGRVFKQVRHDRQYWEEKLQRVFYGEGTQHWRTSTNIMAFTLIPALVGDKFYVLNTSPGIMPESSPDDEERNRNFSVVVLAASQGRGGKRMLLPGLLGRGANGSDTVLASAQVEVFNPRDNWFTDVGEVGLAWRLWTLKGWYWRPRLTQALALPLCAEDDEVRKYLSKVKIKPEDLADDSSLILH